MNLLLDESVDRQIVERLRKQGYDVVYVAEMAPGISDDIVLSRANEKQSLLLTADKDFGELVYRQKKINSGVLLIRLSGLLPERKAEIVARVLRDHSEELRGAFGVLSPGMIRIRYKS